MSCDMTSALNSLVLPLLCLFCKTHTPVVTLTFCKGQICATVFIYSNTSLKAWLIKLHLSVPLLCFVTWMLYSLNLQTNENVHLVDGFEKIWSVKWTGESEKLLRLKRPRMFSQDETTSWKSLLHLRGDGQPWSCSHPLCNLSLNKSWWTSCTPSF